MKTLFEKTYMNKTMAEGAASKKFGKDWDHECTVVRDHGRWVICLTPDEEHRMSEVLAKYRATYVKTKTKDGRTVVDNGDEVARVLRAIPLEVIYLIADTIKDEPLGSHEGRYANLNPGQHRMCAGNVIRAAVKSGEVTLRHIRKLAKQLVQ